MLLGSGMGISAAIGAVRTEIKSSRIRRIIVNLEEDINSGAPLWMAFERTGFLPAHVISLIRIGEEAGRLSENLKIIAIQQERERSFRSKLRSAMMYPVFVIVLTFIIGIGIAWFILPRLAGVFASLNIELPLITRWLIALGNFLGVYGAAAIPAALILFGAVIYFIFFFPGTKFLGQGFLFRLPGVGKLIKQVELARMGFILGTLLEAGLPIVSALNSLADATAFLVYKRFYFFLRDHIEAGNSFQRSFALYPKARTFIPVPIEQMIVSGEQSGRLSATLLRIGELFEAKTETTTKNLAVILEPILLVLVWLGVVAVALAVILPIYSLLGGINQ